MRFLFTLLLSLSCLAGSLQSNAAVITSNQPHKCSAPVTDEQYVSDETLTNYCLIATAVNVPPVHCLQKSVSNFFTGNINQYTGAYIVNDHLQSADLFIARIFAQAFRDKLIFPEHYHW